MDISVVILSWNDLQHLMECLESLTSCSKKRSIEIIVVDNASTDGSPDAVTGRFPEVMLIRNKENLGFPKGNNIGIRASQGKYIYLLNSDIKLLDGCVDSLADYMDMHPDVGMVGPKILNGDRTHQSSCRRFPTLWNNFCTATGLASAFKQSKLLSGEHMLYFNGDRILDVDVLVGCFWVVRRKALDRFGLLDEGFFMYGEDIDWCKRCRQSGLRVVFFPEAEAIHHRGMSTAKRDPVWAAVTQQRSTLRYWQKHHTVVGKFSIRGLILIHILVRMMVHLVRCTIQPGYSEMSNTKLRVSGACLRLLFKESCA